MRFPTRSFAALVLAAGLPAGAEDLTIVAKATRDGGPPVVTTSYVASDRVRMSMAEGSELMFDLKNGQMTMIDGKKKEYSVITRQDMEQLKAKVQQQMNSPEMQRAREQMKSLPPEMQKKMESMMGGFAASFDVHKTGTRRKIAGYNCDNWTVTFGQISKSEQCLTTELQIPAQTWESYREFSESMSSMMAAAGPMAKGMEQMREKFKDMKGFPLAATHTTSVLGRTSTTSTEVTEIKQGPISASAWQIPAGYRKVENPMLKASAAK